MWKRILLVGAAAYAAWLVFLLAYAALTLQKVPAAAPQEVDNTPGTVWLMVGSDSREGLTKKQRRELRTGGDFGKRTDTIMLLHMSGLGAPTLVSIPRDSWLTIPEYTNSAGRTVPAHEAKVNAAFAEGGAPLLNQTLQDATGLHIDHYAEVGFAGIVNLTNAVGGIDVCVEDDIDDVKSGLKLKAGCHSLNGKQALAYVRMRYSDPRGDLGRIERQQEFVSKVAGEVLSWKTVVFPWRQWAIVNAAVDSLAVDEQANLLNLSRLGLGLGQVATGMGEVTTVPTSDSDHWANGQWVLRWDTEAADRLWQSLGAPSGS